MIYLRQFHPKFAIWTQESFISLLTGIKMKKNDLHRQIWICKDKIKQYLTQKERMTDADGHTFHPRKYCVFRCSEYEYLYGPGNDADRRGSGMAPQPDHQTEDRGSVIPVISADRSCRGQYYNKRPVSVWGSQQDDQNNTAGQRNRIYDRVYYHHDRNL